MHDSSLSLMSKFIEKYLMGTGDKINYKVLDFGSKDVNGSYKELFNQIECDYIGLDMEPGKNVHFVPRDLYKWTEIESSSIDVVVSGQALEHTEYFWLIFGEFARVLRKGGLLCVIAPSSGPEHKHPIDCWRFFPDGFRSLCNYSKIDCLETYTNTDTEFDDGSALWNDTILIGRKS
jgi:SAM-dependent methyltransferase